MSLRWPFLSCILRDWINGTIVATGICAVGLGIWLDQRESWRERLMLPTDGPTWVPSTQGLACIALGLALTCFGLARVMSG